MRNRLIALTGFLAMTFVPAVSFSADRTDDFSPKFRKVYLEPERSVLRKGKFRFLLAGTAGYDNNANLNSERTGDSFLQSYFKASFAAPLSEKTDVKTDYEMINLLYAGESQLDLTSHGVRLGLDHKLSTDLLLSTGYSVDVVKYFNSSPDDYLDNAFDVKLTQQLPHKMFHSIEYDLLFRYYDRRYTRTPATLETDKQRNDWRNMFTYEIGKYFKKDLIKLNASYFENDSNDPYLNYYDYDSYKLGASLMHLFSEKLSGILVYSKQHRDYNSRTLVGEVNSTELEKTDLGSAGLFYALNKSLSFGLNYTYRQNHSNESINKYSGSIVSLSTYIKF